MRMSISRIEDNLPRVHIQLSPLQVVEHLNTQEIENRILRIIRRELSVLAPLFDKFRDARYLEHRIRP